MSKAVIMVYNLIAQPWHSMMSIVTIYIFLKFIIKPNWNTFHSVGAKYNTFPSNPYRNTSKYRTVFSFSFFFKWQIPSHLFQTEAIVVPSSPSHELSECLTKRNSSVVIYPIPPPPSVPPVFRLPAPSFPSESRPRNCHLIISIIRRLCFLRVYIFRPKS